MKRLHVWLAGSALLAFAFAPMAPAALTNRYVVKDNPGAGEPYDSPANAAADIQTAVNYAYAGETVLVAAATYDAGGITNWPSGTLLTNRVAIWKAITVRSADNDPTNTIIKGHWDPATNGPTAVRCVYMVNNASLIGFMLTNGATLTATESAKADDRYAGGVLSQSTNTTISNCVIAGNSANSYAGGAYKGTLYNCTLISNVAGNGGGEAGCTLYDCTLTGNSARDWGGGARDGIMYNCTLTGNYALRVGGGARGITLYNCTLTSNTVGSGTGGGVDTCTLRNCTLTGNHAYLGGGANVCTLSNCTLTGNSTTWAGGGANGSILYNCLLVGNEAILSAAVGGGGAFGSALYNSTIVGNKAKYGGGTRDSTQYNCIVYFNQATTTTGENGYGGSFTNCCTTTGITELASGNITNDPMFLANGSGYGTNHVAGNYHLTNGSPCINGGTNQAWMTGATDLDGHRRLDHLFGLVDIGAYEHTFKGTFVSMW